MLGSSTHHKESYII